jgi:phosphoglycolate phosphatase-like HAD superfamily hydrolase
MSTPDPLPSWNDGRVKQSIMDFVARVTLAGGSDFVPPNQRIAVFDNDGTLWCEQPLPVQLFFAFDTAKQKASHDPALATTEPFKSLLAGDLKAVAAQGLKGIAPIMKLTHTGMTLMEFDASVREWLASARHPTFGCPFTDVVYQPMLEVLDFLRANGFLTFIVSGGSTDFMRVFAEETYGIPPPQVIGSTFKTHFEMRDGVPVIVIDPELDLFDDKAAKPVAIAKYIGRQPLACFGNSDGDREMLQITIRGRAVTVPGFGLIVHHTDAEREFAYDRQHVVSGQLDKALDEVADYGWVLADMKRDWNVVFRKDRLRVSPRAEASDRSAP